MGSALHGYARTQSTLATSSGEAELYAIGSGASEALGVAQFLQESRLALTTSITIETDSTAAKSIATRQGTSKLTKHIQLRFLYIQDLVKNSILRIVKVHTSVNPADAMTKHLTQHVLHKHLENIGLWCVDGFDFGTQEATVVNSTMHDSSKTFTIGMIAISFNNEDYVTRTTITHTSFGSNYTSQQATRQGLSLTDLRLVAKGLTWCDMTGLPPLVESDTQDDYPMTEEEQRNYEERASHFPSHIGDVMPSPLDRVVQHFDSQDRRTDVLPPPQARQLSGTPTAPTITPARRRALAADGRLPAPGLLITGQGAVPNTPEPLHKRHKAPVKATKEEAMCYSKLTETAMHFANALKDRKTLADVATTRIEELRNNFVEATLALATSYDEDLLQANANYRGSTDEFTTTVIEYLQIPIENDDYKHTDRCQLIYDLLKEFGTTDTKGLKETGWMQNLSKTQRKAAEALKKNLENYFSTHCQTLTMTHIHADFLEAVKDNYKYDYESKIKNSTELIVGQLQGGGSVHLDNGVIITNLVTIGKAHKIQLHNCRTLLDVLQRQEDKQLQKQMFDFIQLQQGKCHLSPGKKHAVEFTFRGNFEGEELNFKQPDGSWSDFIRVAIEFRFTTQSTLEATTRSLSPLADKIPGSQALCKENFVKHLFDYPEKHPIYDAAPLTERMLLVATGTLLHAPYKTATIRRSTKVTKVPFVIDEDMYYFVLNGSELEQLLVHNVIPSNGTWFKPFNLNYMAHEATRHYVALWNENYEGEVDYLYLCSIKLSQKKFLKEFNRHYVEYNSYVDKGLVYQLLPSELATLAVIEYTGKDFKSYKNYLNDLEEYWWDHTALVGLRDIQKSPRLVHALVNCKTSGKFVLYYYKNKNVIDNIIEGQLVDYIDEEARLNLQTIRDLNDSDVVVQKTNNRGRLTFANLKTTVEQKNAINWLLLKYGQKQEDDLMRTAPEETPLPAQAEMYTKKGDDYYEKEFQIIGKIINETINDTLIDPSRSSSSLG